MFVMDTPLGSNTGSVHNDYVWEILTSMFSKSLKQMPNFNPV